MSQSVIPLESNPEIFSQFAHFLGLEQTHNFVDVYSLSDKDLLSFIPRPVHSLILLFPITENFERLRKEEDLKNKSPPADVVWFKQTIKNACGLYALLNAISNLSNDNFEPNSRILKFKESSKDIAEVEKLINEFQQQYKDLANSGQTEAPDAQDDIIFHFLAFIKKDNKIYELDGRRTGPLELGDADDKENEDLLGESKVFERFQEYIDLADEENKLNFSLIALAPSFE